MKRRKIVLSGTEKQALEELKRLIRYWRKYTCEPIMARAMCRYGETHRYQPDWEEPLRDFIPPRREESYFSREQLNFFNHLKYCRWCFCSLPKNILLGFLAYYTMVEISPEKRNALISEGIKQYLAENPLL